MIESNDKTNENEKSQNLESGSTTSVNNNNDENSTDNSNDDNNDDEAQPATPKGALAERMEKLKALKRRRVTEVEQGNRRDRNLEFQRSKENPRLDARNERKKQESLKLKEKQDAKDNGEDYERKQFWKYSAESVDSWEKKMAKKAKMANNGFTDHTQAAHKKYIKLMSDFKPDMNSYAEKKLESIERAIRNGEDPSDFASAANNLEYASVTDKTSKEAIERLAQDTKKQIIQRETRSRDRKESSDDISWINEKNRVFNQKISRFYDKYTREIRENLERGTAL
ncbi:SYF2 splicing factor-domain-containing protein [Phycomyces blakesleeanus]|uniref:Pre-mRNA-splicing factor SYF2 n=1 Tax=Phycomyces blakesleeanus TaxID=4837 RepID=A0ABR3BFN1_PHYBL